MNEINIKKGKNVALLMSKEKRVIFTAVPKKLFYSRMNVSDFVLREGFIPLNPFMIFDFLLFEEVNRESMRNSNDSLIGKSDEMWVFGDIDQDIMEDIKTAEKLGKEIKFFAVNDKDIKEIDNN